MRLILDLRWVRSTVLDGIARVSLSLTAELLRLRPDWPLLLLFNSKELQQFSLDWIQTYNEGRSLADFIALTPGFSAQSPLNRALLWPQLKRFRPDVYFSFYYVFHPLPVRSVCMVHDLIPLAEPASFRQASTAFKLTMTRPQVLRWLLQPMEGIVTVSEHTRRDLVSRLQLPERQIQVCHPGVEWPSVIGQAPPTLQGLKPGYVLSVGRPDPHKNFAGLIDAYATLSPDLRRLHPLVLVGPLDPRYTPGLQARVQQLGLQGCVWFSGPVQQAELAWLYRNASVFALISRYEGFGLPVLEAMAAGVPVVTSDRSSLPEVAGDAALLVNPDRPMEVAWALHRLLKDRALAERLRECGLHRAAAFSWEHSAHRLAGILNQMLAKA